MPCEFICDGCGKRKKGMNVNGNWLKPFCWYQLSSEESAQVACSRKCIEKIAKETGVTTIVMPV